MKPFWEDIGESDLLSETFRLCAWVLGGGVPGGRGVADGGTWCTQPSMLHADKGRLEGGKEKKKKKNLQYLRRNVQRGGEACDARLLKKAHSA